MVEITFLDSSITDKDLGTASAQEKEDLGRRRKGARNGNSENRGLLQDPQQREGQVFDQGQNIRPGKRDGQQRIGCKCSEYLLSG